MDTFRQDAPPLIDLLVMVDPSPSFVPKRAGVRANLSSLLNRQTNGCVDLRFGIAPADGAPDAGVRLLLNDAGMAWTSSGDPLFVERALSAFDSLPIGSETEACIGPAAALVQDGGLRPGSAFSGLCVTDALEQSINPAAELQVIKTLKAPSPAFWSAVTGLGSSCAVEAIDDGVHRGLVNAAYGSQEDICNATWWQNLVGLNTPSCPLRTQFYLTGAAAGPLEVRIDGQLVPGADWTLDVASNSVVFGAGRAPLPGTTLQISYALACVP